MKDLTRGSIFKLMVGFAVPVMIGNILQLMYNLVDTKIVSQVLGETALAAVGSTNSVNTLVIGFLQGLTNGFAIIAAQYFGASDERNLKKTVAHTLKFGVFISLFLTVMVFVFLRPLLRLLNTPDTIFEEAYAYIRIVFAGMTILMLYNVCCTLLRAIGDAVTPLFFLAFSVTLNIFGDYFFMAVLHMGVRGAAYATVLAQFVAMSGCFAYMLIRYPILRVGRQDFKTDWNLVGKLMATGCSMGFMSSLVSVGTVTLQGAINMFGQEVIVAHSTARRLTELFMMMFSVLGTTMATFCGQNLGAGHSDRIRKGIFTAIFMGWGWSVLVITASYTIAPEMIRLLISSDNRIVIETASLYLRINTLLYFVTAMITIIRNAMQGIGDKVTPIISSSIELIGKVLVVIFLVPRLGYMGIILAEPIVWVFMVIPLIIQIIRNPLLKRN